MELLMVVAIIGVLAAIAIPGLISALSRSKQKRTMADIRSIAMAWETQALEKGGYNVAGYAVYSSIAPEDLLEALSPTYIRQMPVNDGWSVPLRFGADVPWGGFPPAGKYQIISGGRDAQVDASQAPGPFGHYDCDIVFENGAFLAWPEGVQEGDS